MKRWYARARQTVAPMVMIGALACAAGKEPAPAGAPDAHGGHGMGNVVIPDGADYTKADVDFMQGMIAHHAQAIEMSRMAESHGAGKRLLTFTLKIDLSQRAEIDIMQRWLRDRGQVAPDSNAHLTMTMPGMLTREQMKQLDEARGPAFDKLFLELMIMHHEGALAMVQELFAAPNGGQQADVHALAMDIQADQTAEIEKMREMLGNL